MRQENFVSSVFSGTPNPGYDTVIILLHVQSTVRIRINSANSLHYPILDACLTELKRRFNERNFNMMRAIQACSPVSTHFLESNHLQPLADCHDLDCEALRMEAVLAKRTLTKKKMECTAAVLKELSPLRRLFQLCLNYYRLL